MIVILYRKKYWTLLGTAIEKNFVELYIILYQIETLIIEFLK